MSVPPSPLQGRGPGRGAKSPPQPTSPSPLPTLSPEGERDVCLAAIAGAHGLAGEVRLKLFTDDLTALKSHKSFNDGALTLLSVRQGSNGPIARFAEASDRNAAEALRGTSLTIPRDALPPLEPGEYYHSDLIGLPAVSTEGESLGHVVAVENFGAGDVIEVERPSEDGRPGKRFMVPMSLAAVPEWTSERLIIEARFIV